MYIYTQPKTFEEHIHIKQHISTHAKLLTQDQSYPSDTNVGKITSMCTCIRSENNIGSYEIGLTILTFV